MLRWADRFNIFSFLDNQDYSIQPHQVDCLLAAGAINWVVGPKLSELDLFLNKYPGWTFGHISYSLKNQIHNFSSGKEDRIGFPEFFFFTPQVVLQLRKTELTIQADDPDQVYKSLQNENIIRSKLSIPLVQGRLTRAQYIEKILQLQQHIHRGDCYEINFCQEFFAENCTIDPVETFERLINISPNPFSAFYRIHDKYLLCASPERFLTRQGNYIYSQPMKGTIKRNRENPAEDNRLKEELMQSTKDRSENVMVVDMVRNDLTRICNPGSVTVEELFGVYSYPNVHQMISTVKGELKEDINFSDIISATFPMGSMTGAPKHRVMELIEKYETSARGIFSGSVGYINPEKDFDFNVVIRSLMYNSTNRYLSYQVGSGITIYSDPEKEWEECLLKGEAIKKVLTGEPALL